MTNLQTTSFTDEELALNALEEYLEEEIIRGILFSLEQRIKESSIKFNF